MKAKYYPHATAAGAVMMVAAPLCFVLSINRLRSTDAEFEAAMADVVIDSRFDPDVPVYVPMPDESDESKVASAMHSEPEPVEPAVAPKATRVAMLPTRPSSAGTEYVPAVPVPPMSDAAAVLDMATIIESTHELPEASAVPVPSQSSPKPVPSRTISPVSIPDSDARSVVSATAPDKPLMESLVAAGTHFGATAHLAMRKGFQDFGSDEKESPTLDSDSATSAGSLSMSGVPDGGLTAEEDGRAIAEMSSVMRTASGSNSRSEAFGQAPEPVLESVVLQQPLESRRVSRVENVVAITQARGWPVALVRSDLPDDHWWVQQMVGIRGNAFAARANFGNEDSIRGSVYHLVFVFLDSPDEVRRFRIAKQFKKLPEGVRRSREYTFTRR